MFVSTDRDPYEGTPTMTDAPHSTEFLAERFESHRSHLRAVAYRMLGSRAEAEDAVQEAWLRLSRSDTSRVDNLGGWLTTVVGRVCLDMLRTRKSRAEQPLDSGPPVPADTAPDPEQDALLADSVGVALLVVLETLSPAERLAFVLHDLFAVPFDEVATIVGRTPTAARQLASRARRRVQGAEAPDTDLVRQRRVVDAFLAAARDGDFDALVEVLDPDVVARSEAGVNSGAVAVASSASRYSQAALAQPALITRPALIGGNVGIVVLVDGRPVRALSFTVAHDRITAIDITTDPARAADLDITLLDV